MRVAVGTGDEAAGTTFSYRPNGQVEFVIDGRGNRTQYVYDGHDRLERTLFPSATGPSGFNDGTPANALATAGAVNSGDYEQPVYETTANGTRTSATVASFRNRAGETTGFTTDALGRTTYKNLPGSEPDVAYGYDLLGRMTSAATSAQTLTFEYDALGRNLSQTGASGSYSSQYDLAGRRTRLTHPDNFFVDQDYLVTGETTVLRENGATSGAGVLATYAWDDLGRRSSLTRGDGSVLSYSYDNVSRLTQLADNLVGTAYDQTLGFGYTPASQIASNTRSNDAYAWTGHYNLNRSYTANGRNQYSAIASITPTYDSKGNLTSAGSTTYSYSSENLLTSASGGIALAYDPAMRLYQTSGGSAGTTRFQYDGSDLIAEYNGSNAMLRRYVHGPDTDEPLVWYEGSGTSDRRFLHPDERGSIVAVTNSSGTTLNVNGYDEYGIPSSGNVGRFQYTGQTWLPELGMYYYKARIYSPTLGRFLQTDPIGYGGGMNIYAYVGGDPVNYTDPSGACHLMDVGYGWYSPGGEYYGPAPGKYYILVNCINAGGLGGPSNSGHGAGNGGTGGGGGQPAPSRPDPCPSATGPAPNRFQRGNAPYGITNWDRRNPPPGSVKVTALDGTAFFAPAWADFKQAYKDGQHTYTWYGLNMGVGHWGDYDFQRNANTFIAAYSNASNYAVGVYLNGMGYSLKDAIARANSFATRFSSNAGSPLQRDWWIRGWKAAQSGACKR